MNFLLPMLQRLQRSPLLLLLLLALTLLVASCGTKLSGAPQPSARAVDTSLSLPPLSPAARQPKLPRWCAPTCSDALTNERESLLRSQTPAESPVKPASASTTQQ